MRSRKTVLFRPAGRCAWKRGLPRSHREGRRLRGEAQDRRRRRIARLRRRGSYGRRRSCRGKSARRRVQCRRNGRKRRSGRCLGGLNEFSCSRQSTSAGDGGGTIVRRVFVAGGRDGAERLLGGEVSGDRETDSAGLVIRRVGAGAAVAAFSGAAGTMVAGCTGGADTGEAVSSTRGTTGREGAGSAGCARDMGRGTGAAGISGCAGP